MKKAYSAPKLTRYGNVSKLTASGSGRTSENSALGNPGDESNSMNKRP